MEFSRKLKLRPSSRSRHILEHGAMDVARTTSAGGSLAHIVEQLTAFNASNIFSLVLGVDCPDEEAAQ